MTLHGVILRSSYTGLYPQTAARPPLGLTVEGIPRNHHARVLEGVAKNEFPRNAVDLNSGERLQRRLKEAFPLQGSGVAG